MISHSLRAKLRSHVRAGWKKRLMRFRPWPRDLEQWYWYNGAFAYRAPPALTVPALAHCAPIRAFPLWERIHARAYPRARRWPRGNVKGLTI